jgi:hypothetical protein
MTCAFRASGKTFVQSLKGLLVVMAVERRYPVFASMLVTWVFTVKSELWDGARGRVQQRGGGGYTLCERCNNNTGAWYGGEYVAWAKQGLERLARIPDRDEHLSFVPFRGRPLRFLKQVIAMFFSVNNEEFADVHPELVKFVLERSTRGLPPKYKVDLVLVRGGLARGAGVYGTTNLQSGRTEIASEVAHCPFALRLVMDDGLAERRGAIEHFAQFGPDEERDVWIYTMVGHIVTKFPGSRLLRRGHRRGHGDVAEVGLELGGRDAGACGGPVLRGELEVAVAGPVGQYVDDVAEVGWKRSSGSAGLRSSGPRVERVVAAILAAEVGSA